MQSILAASRGALAAAGLDEADLGRAHAGFGLAGAGLKSAVAALLTQPNPFPSIVVETDAYAAWCGACAGADGAILILGTGSCGLAVVGGRQVYVSGWGAEISDEASGNWIGREAIRRALWVYDGRARGTPLSEAVLARFDNSAEAIVAFATTARPADYGALVPLVLEHAAQDDPLGVALIREAAEDAALIIDRLVEVGAPSVCLIGGLAEPLSGWLPLEARKRLSKPKGDALDGAVLMARRAAEGEGAGVTAFALVGARVSNGAHMRDGLAVVVENGRIREVCDADKLTPDIERREITGTLAPGFIDVQVNGGGGVLFNDSPTVEAIRTIGAAHRRFGTTGFLPTLITDTRATMAEAVEAVRAGIAAGVPGLLGIHLEGPFLNPARKGVHDPKLMRPIEDEDIRIMTSLGVGRTVVTLAPEMVAPEVIRRLTQAGVIVSAGHTEASFEQLEVARGNGLRGYTHLFNAMPPLQSRAPGPVGAALFRNDFFGLIVDFHHVSIPTLSVVFSKARIGKTMLVTDAMPTVGTDVETFELQGRTVYRGDGRLTTADGTLAGSDLDMATAVRNITGIGCGYQHAIEMASLTPAKFLRLDHELGRILPGYRANFVLFEGRFDVRRTWIDGVEEVVGG